MYYFAREILSEEPFNSRSAGSYVREWRAHNFLYKMNIMVDSTKDTDLDVAEPLWRRVGYFFLSFLYSFVN